MPKKVKLIKNKCEIEGCQETDNLHLHHIIERTEENTNNHPYNLCIICPNHHAACHSKRLEVIGVFPSTKPPNFRTLVYKLDGVCNIEGITNPYVKFINKSYKIFNEEEK